MRAWLTSNAPAAAASDVRPSSGQPLTLNPLLLGVQKMDPQLRKLLEVSYEAWIDSGINNAAMRGSNKVHHK